MDGNRSVIAPLFIAAGIVFGTILVASHFQDRELETRHGLTVRETYVKPSYKRTSKYTKREASDARKMIKYLLNREEPNGDEEGTLVGIEMLAGGKRVWKRTRKSGGDEWKMSQ